MTQTATGADGADEASPRTGRLSADDWARAGLHLLMTALAHDSRDFR